MKRTEAMEKILAYFEENPDTFADCLEELDGWNGYLNDDRLTPMEELDDIMSGEEPSYILARAFYGYDADTSHGDNRTEFNLNRDYFRFNGYGNLVSSDYREYPEYLSAETVEEMEENKNRIDTIEDNDDLTELFDALENADDEEEEG